MSGIFGLEFENAIVIFEINAPKSLKHEFLTDRKVCGPLLFQGPGLDSGPSYKVCPRKKFF